MSSSRVARRGSILAALTALAAVLVFSLSLGSASASAAPKTTGAAKFAIGSGKTGAFLTRSGVKVNPVGAASVARKGKRFVVTLPVRELTIAKRSDAGLKGGFVLRKGKHAVRIKGLNVAVLKSGKIGVGGAIQKIRPKKSKLTFVNIFNVAGKATAKTVGRKTTANIKNGKVSFTAAVVRKIRNQLGLKRVPTGQIATFNLNAVRTDKLCEVDPDAEGCPVVDPYLDQCGVAATRKVNGSLTPAPAPPEFASIPGVTGPASVSWGFKKSFRFYVRNLANGSIHALGGAQSTGTAPDDSFDFPASGFRYTDNGTPDDMTDDRMVLEGTGTALFCATGHGFRAAISNPTVVIDGSNSRIDADVDANLSGTWIPAQRITLAKLDVSAVTRENREGGSTIEWKNVPVALTKDGTDAICGIGDLDNCSEIYPPDTELDPITVTLASDDLITVQDPFALDGCSVSPTGRVDGRWPDASAVPTLIDGLPTTGPTTISWGFLGTFRNYVHFSPPAGTLLALNGASRTAGGDPARGFSFPVSAGEYAANDPVDTSDDQAVINGTGTALFCKPGHGFWVSISNPSIIIDGENSRIVADLSANESGIWSPAKRVDLADLDLSEITPTYSGGGSEITWSAVPATLSAEAAPFATYQKGQSLDPVTVAVVTDQDD